MLNPVISLFATLLSLPIACFLTPSIAISCTPLSWPALQHVVDRHAQHTASICQVRAVSHDMYLALPRKLIPKYGEMKASIYADSLCIMTPLVKENWDGALEYKRTCQFLSSKAHLRSSPGYPWQLSITDAYLPSQTHCCTVHHCSTAPLSKTTKQ